MGVPTGGAALSHKHAAAIAEPKSHLHQPRAVLNVELCKRSLLLDLEHVTHDLHLVQVGATQLLRAVRAVLRRALELLYGQRDKRLSALSLHVGWLLKSGRVRAARKV
jgi:hypothetical protein